MGTDATQQQKPSRRRLNQIMRQRAEAEFDRLNPTPFIVSHVPVAAKPIVLQKLKHWESRLARHQELYRRYLRYNERRLAEDNPIRSDIRYWEARIIGVNPDDWPAWKWVCDLRQIAISDLCWFLRRTRDRYKYRPIRGNRQALELNLS